MKAIESAVKDNQVRFFPKVLRTLKQTRGISLDELQAIVSLKAPMLNTDDFDSIKKNSEVCSYLSLLLVINKLTCKQYEESRAVSLKYIQIFQEANKRSLDSVLAKLYFYFCLSCEFTDYASCRFVLLDAQRLASLRHDYDSLATIINCLLRNYLHFNLVQQADLLVAKSVFPDSADNNQLARYMYYLGRIRAIQLDYSASYSALVQATRKAPESASGFLQSAFKYQIIVQLLMGEIPERALFRRPLLQKSLHAYFQICQSVRQGDITKFQQTLSAHEKEFSADKTLTLILRLRHNVIKAGIKMIGTSYSCISFQCVAEKLCLENAIDAEFVVAKAIKDNVIDAKIFHDKGYIRTKENIDVYSTNEPQHAFNQRINFCLGLYNESVKALRYPNTKVVSKITEELKKVQAEVEEELEALEEAEENE